MELAQITLHISAALLSGSIMLLTGCSKSEGEGNVDIRLKGSTEDTTFSLPKKFEVVQGSLIRLTCTYPAMEKCRNGGMPREDDITIYIQQSDREGLTEWMIKNASDRFDKARPGREYYDGEQGIYTVYRAVVGAGKDTATEVVTLVFPAKDGALVGVEDPGSWSHNYSVHRKIGKNLKVKYLISKPVGRDFPAIDERVVTFIKGKIK